MVAVLANRLASESLNKSGMNVKSSISNLEYGIAEDSFVIDDKGRRFNRSGIVNI